MSLINDTLVVAAQKSIDGKKYKVVDNKHVPYDSSAEVLSTITATRRHIGQLFRVANGAIIEDWEFVGGIADVNLVKKVSGGAGTDGKSAYEVAVDNGFEGDEAAWLASLKGEDGATGADGADGQGVPTGGTVGQVLKKVDNIDYNTEWADEASGDENIAGGEFTGELDVSEGKSVFYDDYITGSVVNISLSTTKVLGSVATVRIKADLTGTIPVGWNISGAPITDNPAKINELTIIYINDSDIRLVNRAVAYTDVTPPSVPDNLAYNSLTPLSVIVTWDASTDDVLVSSYKVYKDGVFEKEVTTNSASVSGLTPETTYSFTVTALDPTGNESAQSAALSVTTLAESSVTAEYTAMLAYATTNGLTLPSEDQQTIDNQKIVSLKDEGVWDELDVVYIFNADYTAAWAVNFYRINWKNPSNFFLGTDSGKDPSYTTGNGFNTGSVSPKYMKTGWVPSTDAVKFQANNCSIIFSLFNVPTDGSVGAVASGGRVSGTVAHNLINNNAINTLTARICTPTGGNFTITQADVNGHYHRYYDGTNDKCFKDGVELTVSSASTGTRGLAAVEPYLLGWNNNGSANGTGKAVGLKYWIAASNLAAKETAIRNILNP